MIILDVPQRSPEWYEARRGVITASMFSKILTPTGKLSAQSRGYMNQLLAEWLSGKVEETPETMWMKRGIELEPEAINFYRLTHPGDPTFPGFCFLDERRLVGCSPDALVGEGGLEIKCPSGAVQVEFLLSGEVPQEHQPQIQGSLWITGCQWWDFLSYHPDLPSRVVRVQRNEEYIASLSGAVNELVARMEDAKKLLSKEV